MPDVVISAVICTRNRAGRLASALQSLARQSVPADSYEIIVVDNGSTDGTKRVVDGSAAERSARYVFEPKVGLSPARNSGWRAARGRYVAYLDDDAVATRGWLEAALAGFTGTGATPGCVGGRVLPRWEAAPPRWLTAKLRDYLSLIDWPGGPCELRPGQWLGGGNSAYPRQLLASLGGFREDLGRVDRRLTSMEENDVHQQIEARRLRTLYLPAMTIYHHIPAARLRRRWFLRRCFWQGVSRSLMDPRHATPGPSDAIPKPSRQSLFERCCMAVEELGIAWGTLGKLGAR